MWWAWRHILRFVATSDQRPQLCTSSSLVLVVVDLLTFVRESAKWRMTSPMHACAREAILQIRDLDLFCCFFVEPTNTVNFEKFSQYLKVSTFSKLRSWLKSVSYKLSKNVVLPILPKIRLYRKLPAMHSYIVQWILHSSEKFEKTQIDVMYM